MNLREIDVLISEKVLRNSVFSIGGDDDNTRLQEGNDKGTRNLPRYSSNISAAWELVGMLPTYFILRNELDNKYSVYEDDRKFQDGIDLAYADTAPLALCLAILKFWGIEVPNE